MASFHQSKLLRNLHDSLYSRLLSIIGTVQSYNVPESVATGDIEKKESPLLKYPFWLGQLTWHDCSKCLLKRSCAVEQDITETVSTRSVLCLHKLLTELCKYELL